jgi:2-polyprenyl-6-methoxyphenol hydroxylase-like FAD-dependent oxidoreductase
MSDRFDAVIVGAGPAGASTALLLARAGWSVALVERQRFPRRKVCGECIAASNLPLLDALGIGAAFARLAGAELHRVALMRGSETIVAPLPSADSGPHRYGRARGREPQARRPSDLFAFKANFRHSTLPADLLPVLSFRGGYGGMVVADDGLATLACCVREERLERDREARPGERAGDVVEAILRRECAGVDAALRGALREGTWLATGPIRPGVRLGAGDGIFRVGNAAGEAHPIVGEGISMALQSAFVLASVLGPERVALVDPQRAGMTQQRLLSGYEALWRRRFSARLRIAAAFAHVAMRPAAATALWPLARRWPGMLTAGARWSGKTRCAPEAARIAALASPGAA